jgi:hypothetical protein
VTFALRFPPAEIVRWAARFPIEDDAAVEAIARVARGRGYLTRSEFLAMCRWKTPRSARRCASNSTEHIREATTLALASRDERAKIGILRLLAGVDWPTASVLLHFLDRRPYPILDVRALWSLGISRAPAYDFGFWERYVAFTRGIAGKAGHSMRTVDRALWQYSKVRQR